MQRKAKGRLKFAAALAVLALVWLVVLPLIGRQPIVSQHIEQQQQRGVNPSALFYSELEFLPDVLHRFERLELHVPANVMRQEKKEVLRR